MVVGAPSRPPPRWTGWSNIDYCYHLHTETGISISCARINKHTNEEECLIPYRSFFYFQILSVMLLLTVLAFIVGPVDTWPSNVISAIFLQEPTLAFIKTVAAFFYGNGVTFFMANRFYFCVIITSSSGPPLPCDSIMRCGKPYDLCRIRQYITPPSEG
jgi:hypothetical protein